MEKMIKIGVRMLACGFFIQPVLVALVFIPILKGRSPVALYVILGVGSLLCIVFGIVTWKYGPRFFVRIFKKLVDVIHTARRPHP